MRRLIAALVLVLPALVPSVASPGIACAAEDGPHAALVVDTGSRVSRLCVALDAASVSGVHLIELAGRQRGLEYSLGFGDQAVCSLDGVGVRGGDCFAAYPEFWGYWHGDGSGGWSWASAGAGGARIGNGDVDGWVWGTGDSAATHDRPPRTLIDAVCRTREPAPEPSPEPQDQSPEEPQEGEVEPSPSARATRKDRGRPEARSSPSPHEQEREREQEVRASASVPDPGSGGPPPALYLALVAAVALAGGGWLKLRVRGPAG